VLVVQCWVYQTGAQVLCKLLYILGYWWHDSEMFSLTPVMQNIHEAKLSQGLPGMCLPTLYVRPMTERCVSLFLMALMRCSVPSTPIRLSA